MLTEKWHMAKHAQRRIQPAKFLLSYFFCSVVMTILYITDQLIFLLLYLQSLSNTWLFPFCNQNAWPSCTLSSTCSCHVTSPLQWWTTSCQYSHSRCLQYRVNAFPRARSIIQMMHGCKWNIQICCPEVDMSSRGRSPSDDISTEGQHIWMFHEQACLICFVVRPTTSKYKIQMNNIFTFMFYPKNIEIPYV